MPECMLSEDFTMCMQCILEFRILSIASLAQQFHQPYSQNNCNNDDDDKTQIHTEICMPVPVAFNVYMLALRFHLHGSRKQNEEWNVYASKQQQRKKWK